MVDYRLKGLGFNQERYFIIKINNLEKEELETIFEYRKLKIKYLLFKKKWLPVYRYER